MPILMPTPEEMQRLSWPQRERIRRAVLHVLRDADKVAAREMLRAETAREFGERVRQQARALEVYAIREDNETIRQRRMALLEAIK